MVKGTADRKKETGNVFRLGPANGLVSKATEQNRDMLLVAKRVRLGQNVFVEMDGCMIPFENTQSSPQFL